MLERLRTLFDLRMRDTLRVALPNGGVLALIHLGDLKLLLELFLILLTMAHTVWRWNRESKKTDK